LSTRLFGGKLSKKNPWKGWMKYLPINLAVDGRPVLVVGGGEVGERKVRALLECGAKVRLVSRELTPGLAELAAAETVEHLGGQYRTEHLSGVDLVFAATDEHELNARVSREAQERGLWINVADQPELCRFIVPAYFRRGDLTIAVSTGGRSPAAAARIKSRLEQEFGPAYGRFLDLMGLVRIRVLAEGRGAKENRTVFRRLADLDSDLLKAVAQNDRAGIEKILTQILGPDYTLSSLGFNPAGRADHE